MGWNFRRSLNLGSLRFNLSKSGARAADASDTAPRVPHICLTLANMGGEWFAGSARAKLGAAEGWQGLDRFPRLPLRQANFIEALQVQPELRRGTEEMSRA